MDPDGNKVELWEPKTWTRQQKCLSSLRCASSRRQQSRPPLRCRLAARSSLRRASRSGCQHDSSSMAARSGSRQSDSRTGARAGHHRVRGRRDQLAQGLGRHRSRGRKAGAGRRIRLRWPWEVRSGRARPTPRHVADRLQRVLQQLGAAPPDFWSVIPAACSRDILPAIIPAT